MGKGNIGGKYEGKLHFGHQYDLHKDWGTKPEFSKGADGTTRGFIGNGDRTYLYKDPNTGFTVIIHADNAKEAAIQAKNSGLVKKRKKR